MSCNRVTWWCGLVLALSWCLAGRAQEDVKYSVDTWSRALGNHRALVLVSEPPGDAVRAHIPWRRRDAQPEAKAVIVQYAGNGNLIPNVVRATVTRESGDIVFQPSQGAGIYAIYFMPYTHSGPNHQFTTSYAAPDDSAVDPAWLERNKLPVTSGQLPEAVVVGIQARQEFDRRDPMELIATADEVRDLVAKYPDQSYLVFPEDRRFPIRMTDDLPLRWVQTGPSAEFKGEAARGEYYVFQIGVCAAKQPIADLALSFQGLPGLVGPEAFRCINLGGTDCRGRPLQKTFAVGQGQVGALWCGVRIPKEAAPGHYEGLLRVQPQDAAPTDVKIALDVSNTVLEDAGDSDLWRQARLRWLDSTIGLDDGIVAPYTPLIVDRQTVACLGREVRFGANGFPDSIQSADNELLAAPLGLLVETAEGVTSWGGGAAKVTKHTPGVVEWESTSSGGAFLLICQARMEFDGYINFRATVRATAAAAVKDIRLEIPFRREAAVYMMGLGRKGGTRPAEWQWTWDPARANNSVWVGDVAGGLQCKLKDNADTWSLYGLGPDGIPKSWGNDGKGGCRVVEQGADRVLVQAYSGERTIAAGEELTFCFGLLVTPVKPLDPRHWNWRYRHEYLKVSEIGTSGETLINIHHGCELNPNINYPFNSVDLLHSYVKQAHEKNVKVKIYYTVRELSNHVAELWALRSLGGEIFPDGPGGGCSWLVEHLVNHYAPAWHEPNLPNDDIDGAIATTGLSRWHNYYLEGLAWLLKNVEIDGLYLDGIGYDRGIMQRVRKVMERTRPGSLIDFHSGNNFDPAYGLSSPANQYMEHFPYIDSVWFGEGYNYNESPDYWLVEISGIPFGLFGEMLQGGGNPWRGMIYGMTNRLGWQGDPRAVWTLWDTFAIREARMLGYWAPNCPVKTNNPNVLATVYRKDGKSLIALASWATEPVQCQLTIDWNALGFKPEAAKIHAPAVANFQEEKAFGVTDPIPVEPGRGWWLIVE